MHNYEIELAASFDVVLDEADRLCEGQVRLKRTRKLAWHRTDYGDECLDREVDVAACGAL
ncbi:MAG: hypothetical protein AYP45_10400 [Candidatus Brocadia carolinensis]|uniref:Uncharacterized protein n=1 Tax=Candidatus Brocadia carolinensis TaxID=1004156 RepID=A0A1V4AST0_9BACT|nr:MAG: hypothetical protein AYP45_10400 [Candidatus Brocadia caroliniensis]